jgi:hypothetical protein
MLETDHDVVRITHDDHVTSRMPTTPLLGPLFKNERSKV